MSWTADAPTGVYKNHDLSSKIRDAAVANSQFMGFADTEPGYGKSKGDTVTITRVHNLPLASTVDENSELPSGRPLIDTQSVTVEEWGYKVKLTEFETNLTHFDLRNKVQRALRDQLRLTMDKMVADAFKSTPYKVCSNGIGAITVDTDGTMSSNPDVNMTAAHIGLMRDILMGDNKVPPFADGSYVLIGSTRALRGIKSDTNYRDWIAPTNGQPFMMGEIPKIDNVRIIESNHFDALDNSINAGVTGEAVMFGADPIFLATADEPELRRGVATDLGRFFDVGWVGTTNAGLTWDTAATTRVLHWTAATL
jgi:N4-gp56 family major capsid protein